MTTLRDVRTAPAPDRPRRRTARRIVGASTPARLWRLGAVLVVACLVTALISVLWGYTRTTTTGDEGRRLAALDYDTAELFEALRGADASASTGIGTDRTSSPTAQARYSSYVAGAHLRLDHAKGLLEPDSPGTAAIEEIAYALPRYTAGVDAAQAERDDDVAKAQVDLAGASRLMDSILVTADGLQRGQRTALAANYERASAFPLTVVLAALVTLAALGGLSVLEARRTKRILNAGLVAAASLTVLTLAWWLVATLVAAGHLDAARDRNTTAAELGEVRIVMLEARSSETAPRLGPDGAPGPAQQIAGDFDRVLRPGGILDAAQRDSTGQAPDAVRDAVTAWRTALAGGAGSDGSRIAFVKLTVTLGDAIDAARGGRTAAVADAETWFTGLAVGPALLMVLAAGCTGAGIGIRLREYPGTGKVRVPHPVQGA